MLSWWMSRIRHKSPVKSPVLTETWETEISQYVTLRLRWYLETKFALQDTCLAQWCVCKWNVTFSCPLNSYSFIFSTNRWITCPTSLYSVLLSSFHSSCCPSSPTKAWQLLAPGQEGTTTHRDRAAGQNKADRFSQSTSAHHQLHSVCGSGRNLVIWRGQCFW